MKTLIDIIDTTNEPNILGINLERLNSINYRLAELEDEFLHATEHQDIKKIEDEISHLQTEKWYIEKNK